MQHVLFSAQLVDGRQICVSPISSDTFETNKAQCLGDDSGYFIYEFDIHRPSAGIEILAKAMSYEAAVRLIDIYVLAAERRTPESHGEDYSLSRHGSRRPISGRPQLP
jgi:hypothetical protein